MVFITKYWKSTLWSFSSYTSKQYTPLCTSFKSKFGTKRFVGFVRLQNSSFLFMSLTTPSTLIVFSCFVWEPRLNCSLLRVTNPINWFRWEYVSVLCFTLPTLFFCNVNYHTVRLNKTLTNSTLLPTTRLCLNKVVVL